MKFKNIFLMICIFFMGFAYSNEPSSNELSSNEPSSNRPYSNGIHFVDRLYDHNFFRKTSLVNSIFRIIIKKDVEKYKNTDLDIGSGTIFYIGDNHFVTNAHVILQDIPSFVTPSFYFFYKGKKLHFSKILSLDVSNDLAILKLREEDFKQVEKDLIPLEIVATAKMPSHLKGVIYGFSSGDLFKRRDYKKNNFQIL